MARPTEEVRKDIANTRDELGSTLEEIGDRVAPDKVKERVKDNVSEKVDDVKGRLSPTRVARRGTESVRQGLRTARLKVMGDGDEGDEDYLVTPSALDNHSRRTSSGNGTSAARGKARQLSERAGDAAGTTADQARSAPQAIKRGAQGNPLLAGMVAFGGGFLLASRLRPTDAERQLAEKAMSRLEPVKQQAMETGRSMAEDLKGVAQESMGQVRRRATEAAETVKEDAVSSAGEVKGEARSSAQQVKGEAKGSARQVKEEAAGAAGQVQRRTSAASRRVKGEAEDAKASVTAKPARSRRTPRPAGTTGPVRRRVSASPR